MTPEQELRRAGDAKSVMESAIFQEAKKHLEDQLSALRRVVPIRDTEMHTRLILMEQLCGQFFGFFELLAQTGRMAEMHLEEQRQRQSLLERGVAMFRSSG